jgi:N-acyl-L-homoserine lactone synthetase
MVATALKLARGFSDRATDLLDRLDYRRAETNDEREQIFRLRYEAYQREGAIAPNFTKKLYDRFDDAENSWTFGLHVDGKIVSSIRICISSPAYPMTPALEAFPDLLEPEVRRHKIIMDSNRFVADAASARAFPELPYISVRLAYVASAYFDADIGTATARREHQAFYRRVFGLKPVSEPRPYPTVTKPLSLMMVDCRAVRQKILTRYPYFRSTFFERRMLFERSLRVPRSTAEMLRAKLPAANVDASEIEGADPLIGARR